MKTSYIDVYGMDSLNQLKAASKVGADVFITLDAGILDYRVELESMFKIKIRTSQEVINGWV